MAGIGRYDPRAMFLLPHEMPQVISANKGNTTAGLAALKNDMSSYGISGGANKIFENSKIIQIVLADTYTYCLLDNGNVKALDSSGNIYKSIDGENLIQIDVSYNVFIGLRKDGTIYGADITGKPTENNFIQVSCGFYHYAALKNDGTIISWGSNEYGQISGTPTTNDFIQISCGQLITAGLKRDGSIKVWGYEYKGSTTAPVGNDFAYISCGNNFGAAIKKDGSIKTWGADGNYYVVTQAPKGYNFVQVSCGWRQAIALTNEGKIIGWGFDGDFSITNIKQEKGFWIFKNKSYLIKDLVGNLYNIENNKLNNINSKEISRYNFERYGSIDVPDISLIPVGYKLLHYSDKDIQKFNEKYETVVQDVVYEVYINNKKYSSNSISSQDFILNIPPEDLQLKDNAIKIIIYDSTKEKEIVIDYNIIKEDSETLIFRRRFEYDISYKKDENVNLKSCYGYTISNNSGGVDINIPTIGKSLIKNIKISSNSDIGINKSIEQKMDIVSQELSNNIYKTKIDLSKDILEFNVR